MKRKIHTTLVFTTLMLIMVAAMLVVGAYYPKDVRIVPFVVGVPTLIVLFLLWLGDIYPEQRIFNRIRLLGDTEKEKEDRSDFTRWGQVLNTLGWLLGYAILIFIFGFIVVTPVFLAAFFYRKADLNLTKSVLIAVLSSFAIIRFVKSFGMDLWLGAIPKILPGILGGSIIPPL